ncbi:DUF6882 domain-containing protein [Cellulosimicrobium marinum]|uniref:DUF6882 domain-containing protein n=1 Tax=Cellulosimicrobium marinum TaxID=1638992 RepID=UPI001E3A32E3|nr:DUF6882 domain-containing protein [Cellulosimicrobium marinum]MCB7137079.1 hypothetical protein [Cellulosimicrobium marinum]
MSQPPVLQDLVDDAVFLSHEHQLHLAERHGDDAWHADMAAGRLTFTDPAGTATTYRLQFLGTGAPGPGTWMWAWNNVNDFPDDVVETAVALRDAGLAEATTAEITLSEDLGLRLALAAKATVGLRAHYDAPVGGGTRAWLLLDDPDLALPAPSVPRTVRVLSEGLLTTDVADHRRAVLAYARGRDVTAEDDGAAVRLVLDDGTVVVTFDDRGRIAGIAAAAPSPAEPGSEPEPEPEPEPAPRPGPAAESDAPEPDAASPRRRWFRRRG